MTYEEARNRLLNSEMPKDKTQREYDAVCLSAIEKQIPKKPKEHYVGCYGPYPLWEYNCPRCCMDIDYMDHHCVCGQKLDWGEEE